MEKKILKPKVGLSVPHPLSKRFLLAEGESVIYSTYWRRRVLDGDVSIIEKIEKQKPEVVKPGEKEGGK